MQNVVARAVACVLLPICLGLCNPSAVLADNDAKKSSPDKDGAGQPAYRVKVDRNVVVELVGLSEHPDEDKPWWRPDGTPLSEPPKLIASTTAGSGDNRVARTIVLRATGLPRDAMYEFEVPNSGGGTGSNREGKDGPVHIHSARSFPKEMKTIDVRFEFSTGGWQDVLTVDSGGLALDEYSPLADHVSLRGIEDVEGRVKAKIACPIRIKKQRHAFRVVALDPSGKKKEATHTNSSVSGDSAAELDFEFPMARAEVSKFLVQAVPYRYAVTFKDVAIHLGQQTNLRAVVEDLAGSDRK